MAPKKKKLHGAALASHVAKMAGGGSKQCMQCGKMHAASKKQCEQCGSGIFSKIGDWFKGAANTVKRGATDAWDKTKKFAVKAHDFAKENKLGSQLAREIPYVGGLVSKGVEKLGYGKHHIVMPKAKVISRVRRPAHLVFPGDKPKQFGGAAAKHSYTSL